MKPWEEYKPAAKGPWEDYKPLVSKETQDAFSKSQDYDRPIEAAATSATNAALFGYEPQVEAALNIGAKKIYETTGLLGSSYGAELARQEKAGNLSPVSYTSLRDQAIKENQNLEKYNPVASTVGMVGGGILGGAAGGAALKGAGAIGKGIQALSPLKQAAVAGAATGALYNPGDKEGEISDLQLAERAQGAGIGLLAGGIGQKVGQTVSDLPKAIANKVTQFGERGAVKSAGAYGIKQLKELMNKNSISKVANVMKEEGLLSPGQSFDDVLEKSNQKISEYGNKIGKIYDKIGVQSVDPTQLNNDLIKEVVKNRPSVGVGNFDTKMQTYIEEIMNNDAVKTGDIRGLNELKGSVDEMINYSKSTQELPAIQRGLKNIRSVLNDKITDIAQKTGNKDLIDLNKKYSALKDVQSLAKTRVARDTANQMFGLSDKILGGSGSVIGSLTGDTPEEKLKNAAIGGLLVGGGSKLARSYGSPLLTRAALSTGGLLSKVPEISKSVTTGPASRQLLAQQILEARK